MAGVLFVEMIIRFRQVDKDKFMAVKTGLKSVETRAATPKYQKVKAGDVVTFVCGNEKFEKIVKNVTHFKTVADMLKTYSPAQILPSAAGQADLDKMYASFPAYRAKIAEFGIVAWELT